MISDWWPGVVIAYDNKYFKYDAINKESARKLIDVGVPNLQIFYSPL